MTPTTEEDFRERLKNELGWNAAHEYDRHIAEAREPLLAILSALVALGKQTAVPDEDWEAALDEAERLLEKVKP